MSTTRKILLTKRINISVSTISRKTVELLSSAGIEPIVWIVAFIFLAVHNPYTQSEFSFCPLRNLGFHYCPGCGLGRSISFLLHGDPIASFHTHILGIPATVILFYRTLTLSANAVKRNKTMQLTSN